MNYIIIATHSHLATSLIETASMICGNVQDKILYAVELDEKGIVLFEESIRKLATKIRYEDVVIMCDLFGATPFNLCCKYFQANNQKILTGVNLAMLLECLLQTQTSDYKEQIEIIIKAGREGIIENEMFNNSFINATDEDFL